ncbi:hypothetical protein GCM10010411_04790 [Actinomadura fulvescens]|uniref:Transposase n=1 Tax=Actinomadura fulvescens TaxID=46160 RepID=A0ABN3P9Y0_9ACTN
MTAGVEVAPARREVVALDGADHGLSDPGLQTHLGHRETSLLTLLSQGLTDAHAEPPLERTTANPTHTPAISILGTAMPIERQATRSKQGKISHHSRTPAPKIALVHHEIVSLSHPRHAPAVNAPPESGARLT